MTFVRSWSPYSVPCASPRFSLNVLVLEFEGKLPPLVTFSGSSPVDLYKQETRRFSLLRDGMKRERWARWLATLRKVYQKNKLTTATACFLQTSEIIQLIIKLLPQFNLIFLTTQNSIIVVKDMQSFQTKLQCSEDY